MKNNEFYFFLREIVPSLDNTFTMEKALIHIILGHLIFICEPISIIFAALFKTFGMKKDDKIRFVSGCLRTWYFAKRWFPKDGVRRVVFERYQV